MAGARPDLRTALLPSRHPRRSRCRSLSSEAIGAAIVVAAAAAIAAAISCALLRDTSTSCTTHPRAASRAAPPRALHRALTRRTACTSRASLAEPPAAYKPVPPVAGRLRWRAVSGGPRRRTLKQLQKIHSLGSHQFQRHPVGSAFNRKKPWSN